LIFEIVALANSLGLTATAGFSKMTDAGNESWNVTFTIESIAKMQQHMELHHSAKKERLSSWKIRKASLEAAEARRYTPTLSSLRLKELRKAIGSKDIYVRKAVDGKYVRTDKFTVPEEDVPYRKSRNTLYSAVAKCVNKEIPITLCTAKKILALDLPLFEDTFWAKWKAMVEDPTIEWDLVKSMRPLPEITTAYDITAPPNFTMVTEAGFVIQDTMQVHLPVTDDAIKELEAMKPSKQVFSDKKRGHLLMAPAQEPIVGLYSATKNLGGMLTGAVHKFKTEAEAWAAYHKGALKMTDKVEIGI
jgi:hypothetical protein